MSIQIDEIAEIMCVEDDDKMTTLLMLCEKEDLVTIIKTLIAIERLR